MVVGGAEVKDKAPSGEDTVNSCALTDDNKLKTFETVCGADGAKTDKTVTVLIESTAEGLSIVVTNNVGDTFTEKMVRQA